MPAQVDVGILRLEQSIETLSKELDTLKESLNVLKEDQARIIIPKIHKKYTNTEAIKAVNDDDKYVKNTSDAMSGDLVVHGSSILNSNPLSVYCNNAVGTSYGIYIKKTTGSAGFTCEGSGGKIWGFFTGGSAFVVKNQTDNQYQFCIPNNYNGFWIGKSASFVNPGNNILFMNSGNTGFNTSSPTCRCDINSDILRLRTAKTPATAGSAGNQGNICWDANYIYVCISTNSWKRVAIAAGW